MILKNFVVYQTECLDVFDKNLHALRQHVS